MPGPGRTATVSGDSPSPGSVSGAGSSSVSGAGVTTLIPMTYTVPQTLAQPKACAGAKIGTYAWSQGYWRWGDGDLITFLDSPAGREWACGDLTINIADYTNPQQIHDPNMLVAFAQSYHSIVANHDAILWLSYGDVVSKNGSSMVEFTRTFFAWVSSIPADVALSMGKIGISYDVEHLDPEFTKAALTIARDLRQKTSFPPGSLLIQHTIEGANNVVGTDYVMRLADSALAMVYRNYMHDPTGKYQDDSNILNRLMWMLTQQCVNCLNDSFAASNYVAKITVMVEASCKMGAGCGKLSFCAFDSPADGAHRVVDVMNQMDTALIIGGYMTQSQYNRLMSTTTPYSTHNWEWYRCFAPFSDSLQYANCTSYHTLAKDCRSL